MTLSLIQYVDRRGKRGVAVIRDGGAPRHVPRASSTLALAQDAYARGETLEEILLSREIGVEVDLTGVTLLPPVDHRDPAHLLLSGTGLTHFGSAEQRDRMHRVMASTGEDQTDSMRMFLMGVEGGKPAAGATGVQPEWFYKGDGDALRPPGSPLPAPAFGLDAGEEPELAGAYFIAEDGSPVRMGFALANEFSDHVMERRNYLWLAHSKLRPAAIGPELLVSELPARVDGRSRIVRGGVELWSGAFSTGEENMSHSIANLEHHHFKYPQFRRPGDVHIHFFGTATLSFGDGITTQPGDVIEISAPPFSLPLRNSVARAAGASVRVRSLC